MARKAALSEARLTASICRESFEDFVRHFWLCIPGVGDLIWNWHLSVLCEELQTVAERVFAGQPKLYDCIVNISPGTSKSSICSILFPAWTWTRKPNCRVLTASHTDLLVLDLANKSRTVIKSEKYQTCFPEIEIDPTQDSKTYFVNTCGGMRITSTVAGKSPTGHHADLAIVDDPLDPKKANSDAELKIAEEFMTNVLPSRKVDKRVSVTFLIAQRLHQRDPAGVLLEKAQQGVVKIRHIRLPATDDFPIHPPDLRKHYEENDGLMDPVRLPRESLAEQRALLLEYGYCSQFGQDPRMREGGMFKEQSFGPSQRKQIAPFEAKRIRYWDRAATEGGGCYTAGVLLSLDKQNYAYVEHCVHGQWGTKKRNEIILATAHRDRNRYGPNYEPIIYVEIEGGSSGIDAWLELARLLRGFHVRKDRPTGSKETRAEPWSSYVEAGTTFFVDDGSWDFRNYVEEHCLFPQGRFRDQVDASAAAFNLLTNRKKAGTLHTYPIKRREKKSTLQIIICTLKELSSLPLEGKGVLVLLTDPLSKAPGVPQDVIGHLQATLTLSFTNLDPRGLQEGWDKPVPMYNQPLEKLIMGREHGTRLWSFLLRDHGAPLTTIVLVDEGDGRALSVAQGVCDALRLPRKEVVSFLAREDNEEVGGEPPNKHIYQVAKTSKALVRGG